MDGDSGLKQDKSKTTPSSHRDFFAKLYGSLEEEYNKKRTLASKKDSLNETICDQETTDADVRVRNDSKLDNIIYSDTVDDDSDDEKGSRNEAKGLKMSLSTETSPGSSPTKDEEISPPRIPPPTLKQFQKRLEVSANTLSYS